MAVAVVAYSLLSPLLFLFCKPEMKHTPLLLVLLSLKSNVSGSKDLGNLSISSSDCNVYVFTALI